VLTIFFLRPRRQEKDTKKKREKSSREKIQVLEDKTKRGTNKKQKKERI